MPTTAGTAGDTDRQHNRQVLVVFIGLMLGNALAALDATIVSTALPTIVGDLGGLQDLSWVATAYLLTSVATTPLYGKLGDMYGRKRIFLVAIVIFLTGSLLCGAAQSMDQLIVCRGIQGLGAGGLVSIPMAVIADLVPARDLGRWIGYSGFVFAFASVAGPLLGGLFSEHLSWRWAFLINLPVGIIAFTIVSLGLKLATRRTEHRIDYLGAGLLTGAVGCVVLLTSWGGSREPWGSPVIIGLGAAALVLVVLLVLQERRAPEPILPPRLFRISIARVALGINLLVGLLFFAGLYFISAFLQFVNGIDATSAGVYMIPFMGSTVTTTIIVGRLVDRTGRYRIYPIIGTAVTTVGLVLLAGLDADSSTSDVLLSGMVLGFGIGLVMQVLILAIQNAVDARDIGVATGTSMFMRQLGGAVGLALLGSIFNSQLKHWIPRLTPSDAHLNLTRLRGRPETLAHLPPGTRMGVIDAFARSLHSVFLWSIPIAIVAFVLALFLREIPLKEHLEGPGDDLAVAYEGAVLSSTRAAFVGIGNMGGPMAANALAAGHEVAVFDVSPERVAALMELGARAASSPADAARGAEVVDLVVLDAPQVEAATSGPDGVLAGVEPGAVVAVHSTVHPSTIHALAAAAPDGVDVVDAPISGGVPGATNATLCVMVGGDEAAFERARPVFESVGSFVVHVGPLGAGLGAKLARNLVGYIGMLAAREGARLAIEAGVDLDVFRRILDHTGAVSPMMQQTLAWRSGVEYDVGAMVRMAEKDLQAALELAADLGVDLPATQLTFDRAGDAISGPLEQQP